MRFNRLGKMVMGVEFIRGIIYRRLRLRRHEGARESWACGEGRDFRLVLVRLCKQRFCYGGDHGGGWSLFYENHLWRGELGGVCLGYDVIGLGWVGHGGGSISRALGGSAGVEKKGAGGGDGGVCGGDGAFWWGEVGGDWGDDGAGNSERGFFIRGESGGVVFA